MLLFGCLLPSRCLTPPPLVPQHKKLAEGSAYEELPTSVMYSENDISNSIKNGILYLEDPINHVCLCHGHLVPALRAPSMTWWLCQALCVLEGRAVVHMIEEALGLVGFSGIPEGWGCFMLALSVLFPRSLLWAFARGRRLS